MAEEVLFPGFSISERDRRWNLVKELMKSKGIDALIVIGWRGREQFDSYLANEAAEGIVVFPLEGEPAYLTWGGLNVAAHMANSARVGTAWIDDWRPLNTGPGLVAILQEKGLDSANTGVVGLESSGPGEFEGYIPYKTWAYVLEHLPDAKFVDISQSFAELILVKGKEEIRLIRDCARIGEMACEAMLEVTKPGVSESEIYATILKTIFSKGAGVQWPILILQSGIDNTGWAPPMWLHGAQSPYTVQEGDIVQAELFPRYGGLETQQQMSVATKPVDPSTQELAAIARRSYDVGLSAIRPGKRFKEVAEAMEVPLTEARCWHMTPLIHSLNPLIVHGPTAVRIAQWPDGMKYKWFRDRPISGGDLLIKPGMVFELEPNACLGNRRINIGGTVLVTQEGAEELNKLSTEMRVVA